jgi:hypothetical protein
MIEELAKDLATGFEGHFMRALFISGALALVGTAVAAFAWWRGKRWMANRGTERVPAVPHAAMFSQNPGSPGASAGGAPGRDARGGHADEQPGGRLIREAAARAAGLRDAWDRSYREARSSEGPTETASPPQLDLLIEQLLREQQETNALLRQIVGQLGERR